MYIAVFCSSSEGLKPEFTAAAAELGEWIGRNSHTLVYGGSDKGLMRECARAVKANGGRIISVAPSFVVENGLLNPESDENVSVSSLAERKSKMMQLADVFVALPGGIGTLDEIFSIAACNVVGECGKPILLMNLEGIYDDLRNLLAKLEKERLLRPENMKHIHFCNTLQECTDMIRNKILP